MFEYEVYHRRNGIKLYNQDRENNNLIISMLYEKAEDVENLFLSRTDGRKKELTYDLAKEIVDKSRYVVGIMLEQHRRGTLLNPWDSHGYVYFEDGHNHDIKRHSVNVPIASLRSAISAGIDSEMLLGICVGGMIHDVAKYFHYDLVNSGRKLTEKEYRKIQKHPEEGYDAVKKSIEQLCSEGEISEKTRDNILFIVRYHQQKNDGSGYPFEGINIPYIAQFVQLYDSLDAMTSRRKYNSLKTKEESLDEILANSGSQFNSSVVDIARVQFDDYLNDSDYTNTGCGAGFSKNNDAKLKSASEGTGCFFNFNRSRKLMQSSANYAADDQSNKKSQEVFPLFNTKMLNLRKNLELIFQMEDDGDMVLN